MRAVRISVYALLIIVAILATAIVIAALNKTRIANFVLSRIRDRTGIDIRISGTRLDIGSQIVVILENPRVFAASQEVARLQDIRAVLTFPAIICNGGLPIQRLVLDQPHVMVPSAGGNLSGKLPQIDSELVQQLQSGLTRLADTVTHIVLIDAVAEKNQTTLVDHLNVRIHPRADVNVENLAWLVDFSCELPEPGVAGMQLSGVLSLGRKPGTNLLDGRMWFWGLELHNFALGPSLLSTKIDGNLQVALNEAGSLTGQTQVNLHSPAFSGGMLTKTLQLNDYRLATSFAASPMQLTLPKLQISQGQQQQLLGSVILTQPFDPQRTLSFSLMGPSIPLTGLATFVRSLKGISPELTKTAASINAGTLILSQVSMDAKQPLSQWNLNMIRDQIRIDAMVRNVGYQFGGDTKLLALRALNGRITYAGGGLRLTQGSLRLGTSRIDDIFVESNWQRAPAKVSYATRLKAVLDLDEVYPAIAKRLETANPQFGNRLAAIDGVAPMTLSASGDLKNFLWQKPRNYQVSLETHKITMMVRQAPDAIVLKAGDVRLKPGLVKVDHVRLQPGQGDSGFIVLNGSIESRASNAHLRNFTAQFRQFELSPWLPLFVPPKVVAVEGRIDGLLTANSVGRVTLPVIKGKLTMTVPGVFHLGILRAPIATRYVIAVLDGKSFSLKIAAGTLEDSPMTLRLRIADIIHPALRIDATADKLNIDVLSFIHPPWENSAGPPPAFHGPVSGHVEVRQGTIGSLPLTHISTDFLSNRKEWLVDNFHAEVAGGNANLSISGVPGSNNWVNIAGKLTNVDTAKLMQMLNPEAVAPITGILSASPNLWIDTDSDFFDSIGGYLGIVIKDGRLNRLTLLSRILGLINLKSWLTADVPDLRLTGLPFHTISGEFVGKDSQLSTNNLRLQGSILEMAADGRINLGTGRINMQIEVAPYLTANWLLSKIPLLGKHIVGGTKNLLAAYFQVTGPYKDPNVIPKPITSVAEFIKKIFGLPFNIIAPNTIK